MDQQQQQQQQGPQNYPPGAANQWYPYGFGEFNDLVCANAFLFFSFFVFLSSDAFL